MIERLRWDKDGAFIEIFVVTLLRRKPIRGIGVLRQIVLFLIVNVVQSYPDMPRAYALRDVIDLLNNPVNGGAAIAVKIAHAVDAYDTIDFRATINHCIGDVTEIRIQGANVGMT